MDLTFLQKIKNAYETGIAYYTQTKAWVKEHKTLVLVIAVALVLFKIC
jgi:hypothetical protein